MNTIRPLLMKLSIAIGILGAGAVLATSPAFAASSASQATTITLSVPASISMTGLATSYSAVAPAGVTTRIDNQMTVNTNDPLGFNLSIVYASANFTGAANSFAASNDLLSVCDSTGAFCGVGTAGGNTTPVTLFTTSSANAADQFVIAHSISVPAAQGPDSYSVGITYTASAN